MVSSSSGFVKTSAMFGASSSSPRLVRAVPPVLVHSQPSMPSSRGITAVALTRRRIGKRPTMPDTFAGPGSTEATLTRPSGSWSGACSTRPCSTVTPCAVSRRRSSSLARGLRQPRELSMAKVSASRVTAGCSGCCGDGGGLEGGGTDMARIVIGGRAVGV